MTNHDRSADHPHCITKELTWTITLFSLPMLAWQTGDSSVLFQIEHTTAIFWQM